MGLYKYGLKKGKSTRKSFLLPPLSLSFQLEGKLHELISR
jgi:hypothetical protein